MKVLIVFSCVLASALAGSLAKHLPRFNPEGRITNGEVAERGQFPYQVGLSLTHPNGTYWCGGTLISNRWIVTAAHCTDEVLGVTVYLGANNIKLSNEKGQQRVYVSKSGIITHEDFDENTITNDIAVIKLPVEIHFDQYIQPALLPKKSSVYSTYVGDEVIASGWGRDSDSATSVSEVLNYLETTVIKKSSCNIYYLGAIQDNMICINAKQGRSICSGDSGGPLIHKENGENVVIGATSFGIKLGCEIGWPGVFTRITSYLDWIEEKTGLSR